MSIALTKPAIGSTSWGSALNQNWTDIEDALEGTQTIGPLNLTNEAGNYLRLPQLTTTQRDALSAVNGMMIYNSTTSEIQAYENGAWGALGGGGATMDYIHIEDRKSSGTAGGTFSSGAWRTRDLNTEVSDTGGHASLSSNQITLAAGTYVVRASASANQVGQNRIRLQNVTDGTTIFDGTNAAPTNEGRSFVYGRFTLASQKTLELQHRCYSTGGSDSFGLPVGNFWTVNHETYSVVEFWKVA